MVNRRSFTPPCDRARRGWYCTRPYAHPGPCAAVARWWNLSVWLHVIRRI